MRHDPAPDKPLMPGPGHWPRFRRFLRGSVVLGLALAVAALVYLRLTGTIMPWLGQLAVALGVTLSTMLAGALMGLVFVSSRGGYDIAADDSD